MKQTKKTTTKIGMVWCKTCTMIWSVIRMESYNIFPYAYVHTWKKNKFKYTHVELSWKEPVSLSLWFVGFLPSFNSFYEYKSEHDATMQYFILQIFYYLIWCEQWSKWFLHFVFSFRLFFSASMFAFLNSFALSLYHSHLVLRIHIYSLAHCTFSMNF